MGSQPAVRSTSDIVPFLLPARCAVRVSEAADHNRGGVVKRRQGHKAGPLTVRLRTHHDVLSQGGFLECLSMRLAPGTRTQVVGGVCGGLPPQHAQLSVESRKRRLHPRCRVRHADWDERCRVARAPPAGDQPEDWRATDPETGGHQPQNWRGAVYFLTLTWTVTCPRSVHQRHPLPVGGQPVRLFYGLSKYVGRGRDRR